MRPFLPPLLAGALARGDVAGVDFDGSGYDFLEEPAFLLAVFALAVFSYVAERSRPNRRAGTAGGPDPVALGFAVLALVLGALLFAGSLAEGGAAGWPGLIAGAACAALGYVGVASLFERARARLDEAGAALLPIYADALALGLALVAAFVAPVSFVALAAFAWLTLRSRQGEDRKYAGLRILR